eukprot:4269841-Pleurochrysis_carterae.AAC.3
MTEKLAVTSNGKNVGDGAAGATIDTGNDGATDESESADAVSSAGVAASAQGVGAAAEDGEFVPKNSQTGNEDLSDKP